MYKRQVRYRRLLVVLTLLQITLGAILLVFRAVAIRAIPVTCVFESMVLLLVIIGVTFLILSAFIHQVWFLSIMVWVLFVIAILAAMVAKPAADLQEAAKSPWAIIHALTMVLSGAMIVFSAAMSILFIWSQQRLKSGRFMTLFGKMPTIEKLEKLMLFGLHLGFAGMTFGLLSGIGLVAGKTAQLGMTFGDWLTDSKIVLIFIAWFLLLGVLVMRRFLAWSGKTVAQATLIICFLILFAFIGSQIFCKSSHDFGVESSASGRLNYYDDCSDRC